MAIDKFPIHAAATAGDLNALQKLIAGSAERVVAESPQWRSHNRWWESRHR
jgi:hypothetical protein